jgi:hypothetical protein
MPLENLPDTSRDVKDVKWYLYPCSFNITATRQGEQPKHSQGSALLISTMMLPPLLEPSVVIHANSPQPKKRHLERVTLSMPGQGLANYLNSQNNINPHIGISEVSK